VGSVAHARRPDLTSYGREPSAAVGHHRARRNLLELPPGNPPPGRERPAARSVPAARLPTWQRPREKGTTDERLDSSAVAALAQSVEHLTRNEKVWGSIPQGGSARMAP